MVLMSPHALAFPLHMFIKTPRNRNPHPTVSYASPWRLTMRPNGKGFGLDDIPDSCMRETWSVYLGRHLLSILLMVKYALLLDQ